jgi:hypothetical protein
MASDSLLIDGDNLIARRSNTVFCFTLPDLNLNWMVEAASITADIADSVVLKGRAHCYSISVCLVNQVFLYPQFLFNVVNVINSDIPLNFYIRIWYQPSSRSPARKSMHLFL